MIRSDLIHYTYKSEAYQKKFSADPKNNCYTIGPRGTSVQFGLPDIPWDKVVFIKDSLELWTHGAIYCDQSLTDALKEVRNDVSALGERVTAIEGDQALLRYDDTLTREEALSVEDKQGVLFFATDAESIIYNGKEYGKASTVSLDIEAMVDFGSGHLFLITDGD